MGLGLVLVYNAQGIPNFAHGELFMAGRVRCVHSECYLGLPYPVAVLLGIAVGGTIGVVVELLAIRPITLHHSLDEHRGKLQSCWPQLVS